MEPEADLAHPGASPEDPSTTLADLPFAVLEEVAMLSSPAAAAAARLACRFCRGPFSARQKHLRLSTQRPTSEATRLLHASPFPRASCATLVLAMTPAAGSQSQVDVWLRALQQRTAITQLTLTCAADPGGWLRAGERIPQLLHCASLQALSSLHHLRALSLDLSPAWSESGAAVVGQLTWLTRLEVGTLYWGETIGTLAASLQRGVALLRVLDLCFGDHSCGGTMQVESVTALLRGAAAGAPHLAVLACRGVLDPPAVMRAVANVFGPAATGMDITCSGICLQVHALRSAGGGAAAMAALHVRPPIGDVGGATAPGAAVDDSDFCAVAAGAAAADVQKLAQQLDSRTLVEELTLDARDHRWAHHLNLALLPGSVRSFAVRCGQMHASPSFRGTAAPALTALNMSFRCYSIAPHHTPPLVATLATCCAHLHSLTLRCDMWSLDGAALTQLRQLTLLSVSAPRPVSQDWYAFPSSWLPSTLLTLRLANVRVPAAGRPADLRRLLSLRVVGCVLDNLTALLGAADSLRKITALHTSASAGAAALLALAEMEELWEVSYKHSDQPKRQSMMALAATATGTAAASAAGSSAAAALTDEAATTTGGSAAAATATAAAASADAATSAGLLLPRLRRLSLSMETLLESPSSLPQLLQRLPPLRELRLITSGRTGVRRHSESGDSSDEGSVGSGNRFLLGPPLQVASALAGLPHLVLLEVSGYRSPSWARYLQVELTASRDRAGLRWPLQAGVVVVAVRHRLDGRNCAGSVDQALDSDSEDERESEGRSQYSEMDSEYDDEYDVDNAAAWEEEEWDGEEGAGWSDEGAD